MARPLEYALQLGVPFHFKLGALSILICVLALMAPRGLAPSSSADLQNTATELLSHWRALVEAQNVAKTWTGGHTPQMAFTVTKGKVTAVAARALTEDEASICSHAPTPALLHPTQSPHRPSLTQNNIPEIFLSIPQASMLCETAALEIFGEAVPTVSHSHSG